MNLSFLVNLLLFTHCPMGFCIFLPVFFCHSLPLLSILISSPLLCQKGEKCWKPWKHTALFNLIWFNASPEENNNRINNLGLYGLKYALIYKELFLLLLTSNSVALGKPIKITNCFPSFCRYCPWPISALQFVNYNTI